MSTALYTNADRGFGIMIDYSRDSLLDVFGMQVLKDTYMLATEKSPQESFARAATTYADNAEHAQRIYDYASKLWFMFSTPILANAGTNRGLPISCFLSYVDDSRTGILEHYTENGWLASKGGGIGTYWGALRSDGAKTSSGGTSTGSIPFIKVVDSQVLAFTQSYTRRAAYAAYTDISHPEIEEFIGIRKPTGGDANRKCLNLHHGVNISDKFMQLIDDLSEGRTEDDSWDLIDPHSKEVVKTISATTLWMQILELRMATGEPYLHFIDTSNKHLHPAQKALGLEINTSNLCSEIILPTSSDRTAVCCLSSLNLEYFREWEKTTIVRDAIRFLDNVLDMFILTAPYSMKKAVNSASRERSLGLGTMGFHSYLQRLGIAFGSQEATVENKYIYNRIYYDALAESYKLGTERGAAPDFKDAANKGYEGFDVRRNMYLIAIAPNASSSIICGNTSPSIEPLKANAFKQENRSGTFIHKNKYLDEIVRESCTIGDTTHMGEYDAVWKDIIAHGGSVQHLEWLTDQQKAVFKTATEIDQADIIKHAAERQQYIDQAQSVNLFFDADTDVQVLHDIHMSAWKKGLKTLYYCRSSITNRVENIGERFDRQEIKKDEEFKQTQFKTVLPNGVEISCQGCEG